MDDREKQIPGRERVHKAMFGLYDVAKDLSENGGLSSADGGQVRDLIKALESGITRFDTEIDMGFGQKITLQELIEKIIDKCIRRSEESKQTAGQETDFSKNLDKFWKNLKEATYGDLDHNRTIN